MHDWCRQGWKENMGPHPPLANCIQGLLCYRKVPVKGRRKCFDAVVSPDALFGCGHRTLHQKDVACRKFLHADMPWFGHRRTLIGHASGMKFIIAGMDGWPRLSHRFTWARHQLPSSSFSAACRCHCILDTFGDHRAACAQSGMLRSHGGPRERATTRICREAGARVTINIGVNDLNTNDHHRHDEGRIEVIANVLPLRNGTQLAVDTTLVSPLSRESLPRRRAGRFAGAALQEPAKAKKERTQNFSTTNAAGWSCFQSGLGGRWSEEAAAFISNLDIPVGAGLNSNANNNANLIVSSDQAMHSYHQYFHHLSSQRIPCAYSMQPVCTNVKGAKRGVLTSDFPAHTCLVPKLHAHFFPRAILLSTEF